MSNLSSIRPVGQAFQPDSSVEISLRQAGKPDLPGSSVRSLGDGGFLAFSIGRELRENNDGGVTQ
jgi:hypothetical protein